jgi:hypothetical protein
MQYKDAALGDTIYFWFAVNDVTGAAGDGANPLYDVRLAGAAANAAPVLSGTPTLLTHANYSDGLFEIAVAATTGNGFAAGNEYAVFCTLTISTVNPAGFVGSVKLYAAILSSYEVLTAIKNKTDSLAFTVAGDVDCNVQSWKGAAAPDISDDATIAAAVVSAFLAGTGAVATDAGNSATAFKTNLGSAVNDFYKDMLLVLTSGALSGQVKRIQAYNGSSKVITLYGGFTGTPADAVTFALINK